MVIESNFEPGSGAAHKSVDSKNLADSAAETPKTSSESMKVVKDNFQKISTGLVGPRHWIPHGRN